VSVCSDPLPVCSTAAASDGQTASIAVFGLGSMLFHDDGIGPECVRRFEAGGCLPDTVELCDLGTPSLDLASRLIGLQGAIFIDAIKLEAVPGTVVVYDRDEILNSKQPAQRMSGHEPTLREALMTAELIGAEIQQVCLVGIVVDSLERGIGLSEPVIDAWPNVRQIVLDTIERWSAP
jgi:hydrogenase maturation protease